MATGNVSRSCRASVSQIAVCSFVGSSTDRVQSLQDQDSFCSTSEKSFMFSISPTSLDSYKPVPICTRAYHSNHSCCEKGGKVEVRPLGPSGLAYCRPANAQERYPFAPAPPWTFFGTVCGTFRAEAPSILTGSVVPRCSRECGPRFCAND